MSFGVGRKLVWLLSVTLIVLSVQPSSSDIAPSSDGEVRLSWQQVSTLSSWSLRPELDSVVFVIHVYPSMLVQSLAVILFVQIQKILTVKCVTSSLLMGRLSHYAIWFACLGCRRFNMWYSTSKPTRGTTAHSSIIPLTGVCHIWALKLHFSI